MKGIWIKHRLVILGATALLAVWPAASALAADGPDFSAQQIVEDCRANAGDGEGIGACVSAKVQELRDTGDEHAAEVADAAQEKPPVLAEGARHPAEERRARVA